MTDDYRSAGFRAPSPSRPGRPKNAASREQFLDAAVDLFGRQGVSATTLANIAKEVGVTSAMVHYHFANRDQLLDAVVAERILPFVVAIHEPIKPEALHNPAQVFREMAECMIDHVLRQPWLASTWLSDIGSTSGDLCQRVMPYIPIERVDQLTAATIAAQARGELNAQLLPHMVFMSMAGLVLLPFASISTCSEVHPDADFSTDALRRHVMSAVDNLLCPKP
jgi:AcrR family transcriptional regulator